LAIGSENETALGNTGALPETKMVDLVGKVEKANLAAMGGKVET